MDDSPKKLSAGRAKQIEKSYLKARSQSADPLDLLIMMHDGAIQAARRGDKEHVRRLLDMMIAALDFEKHPMFALGQFRVYKHCQHSAKLGQFDDVLHLLCPMRDAWEHMRVVRKSGAQAGSKAE